MIQTCIHCGFINGNADEHTIFCPNCGEPYPLLRDVTVQAPQATAYSGSSPYASYDASPYTTSPYGATPYPQSGRSGIVPPPPPGVTGARPAQRGNRAGMGGFIGGILVGLGLILLVGTVLAAAALTHNGNSGNNAIAQTATATPSPTHVRPTPTTLPPTATAVPLIAYNDPAFRFTMQYPATWATNVTNGRINGIYPANFTTFTGSVPTYQLFEVMVTAERLSSGELKTFVQGNGGANYQQIGGTTSATYAGEDWHVVTGTFNSTTGTTYTARMLYVRHNDITTYALFLVAQQDQFSKINQQTFVPMLQSFNFGANPT